MKTYTVTRHMQGDRDYSPGETRALADHEAAPLLASGALVLAKAEPPVRETKVELGRAVKAKDAPRPQPAPDVFETQGDASAETGDASL